MREASRTFEIGPAGTVALQVYGDLIVRQGDAPSVTVDGDTELVERAWAETRQERLELTLGRDWGERIASGLAMLGNRPLRFTVTLPDPHRIEVAGRGRLDVRGLRTEQLTLRVAGLADGDLADLQVGRLAIDVAGRGELRVAGRADDLRIGVSGSADLDAYGLACARADVRISGHGDVRLQVRERLEASIAGYGHVTYMGDPTVEQRVSGGGAVRRREPAAPIGGGQSGGGQSGGGQTGDGQNA